MFPITLKEPIMQGKRELVPAGTKGEGEVVWAKKAGGSGSPGELVLAARYLDLGGRHLRLRSMNFGAVGGNRYKDVNKLMIVGTATLPGLVLVGFFVKGGETMVAAGTLAQAKTAAIFDAAAPPDGQIAKEKNTDATP